MYRFKKIVFLCSLFLSFSLLAFSQTDIENDGLVISGKVFDKQSKLGVAYASVILGDTRRGTVCDSLGFFRMTVYVKKSLKVSALGFYDKIIRTSEFGNQEEVFLNIDMNRSSLMLEQVDVYDPGNWQQFKHAVLNSKLKEKDKNIQTLENDVDDLKLKKKTASFSISRSKNKEQRRLDKLKTKDYQASLINTKLTRDYVEGLTGEKGERLDSLMLKINRENHFTKNTSEYMIGIIVLQYHRDFQEKFPVNTDKK